MSLLTPCPERTGCVLVSRSPNRDITAREVLLGEGEPRLASLGRAQRRFAMAGAPGHVWIVDDVAVRRLCLTTFRCDGEAPLPAQHAVDRILVGDAAHVLLATGQQALRAARHDDGSVSLGALERGTTPDFILGSGADEMWIHGASGAVQPLGASSTSAELPPVARLSAADGAVLGIGVSPDDRGVLHPNSTLVVWTPPGGPARVAGCPAVEVLGSDAQRRWVVLTAPRALGQPYFPWPDLPERVELRDRATLRKVGARAVRGEFFGLVRPGTVLSFELRGPRSHRLHALCWDGELGSPAIAGWKCR